MKKLNVLMIGAHPDDCDIRIGGTALKFADLGHRVKFVSATNGASGHHIIGGMPLALRRQAEAQAVAKYAGIEYELLDNPDAWLTTDLSVRAGFIKLLREFKPDLVITHRPNDYHPDHRNTSVLVQDSSYLVMVQSVCPFSPALDYQPVILYMRDAFRKPAPFAADIVVDIDAVVDRKMEMFACHESQAWEFLPYINKTPGPIPEGRAERMAWLKKIWTVDDIDVANESRDLLVAKYGPARGNAVVYAESFEICEYGGKLTPDKYGEYFPF